MTAAEKVSTLRLLGDLVLVKPLDFYSSTIILPQVDSLRSDKPGHWADQFYGEVVAIGPGDKIVVGRCRLCGAEGQCRIDWNKFTFPRCSCGERDFAIVRVDRAEMYCKLGDRIVFPRRPTQPGGDSSLVLGDFPNQERYLCFHEEQFAYAIVEGEVGMSRSAPEEPVEHKTAEEGGFDD